MTDDVVDLASRAGPHDTPTAAELLEAAREFVAAELADAVDSRLRFLCRVTANALSMVERELELGPLQAVAHRGRLEALGVVDDDELARGIREGRFDDRLDEVTASVRASVVDKLRVANPGYLHPIDRDAIHDWRDLTSGP